MADLAQTVADLARRVARLEDMPTGYREGSLFLTGKPAMPWFL